MYDEAGVMLTLALGLPGRAMTLVSQLLCSTMLSRPYTRQYSIQGWMLLCRCDNGARLGSMQQAYKPLCTSCTLVPLANSADVSRHEVAMLTRVMSCSLLLPLSFQDRLERQTKTTHVDCQLLVFSELMAVHSVGASGQAGLLPGRPSAQAMSHTVRQAVNVTQSVQ